MGEALIWECQFDKGVPPASMGDTLSQAHSYHHKSYLEIAELNRHTDLIDTF